MVRNLKALRTHCPTEQTAGHRKAFHLSETGQKALTAAVPIWNTAQQKLKAFLGEADSKAILRIGSKLQHWNM